ncbi:MAG: methyltransferase domain-containing protein, partial [Deltaproteobacteria bacterium]|nr:methyltransferase domain-containing protein [Deltaproteobacteria bacterium]
MDNLFNSKLRLSEVLPRYLFLEPFVTGKRVLEVEAGLGASASFLAQLQAARVVGIDFDEQIVAAGRQRVERRTIDLRLARDSHWPADDGAFDLVIDFGLGVSLRAGKQQRLEELRRVLARDGLLVTAVRNPAGVGISDLVGAAEEQTTEYATVVSALNAAFQEVMVFGQSPFLGFSFIGFDVDPNQAGVALDTALMGSTPEEVAYYLVIAGQRVPRRDELELVQLPFSRFAEALIQTAGAERATAEAELQKLRADGQALEVEVARREEALASVADRITTLRDALLEKVEDARTLADVSAGFAAERDRAAQELEANRRALHELVLDRDAVQARYDGLNSQFEQARALVDELQAAGAQLRQRVDEQVRHSLEVESRATGIEAQLISARQQLDDANVALADKLEALAKVSGEAQSYKRDVAELTGKLKLASARVNELEYALERSEERGALSENKAAELAAAQAQVAQQIEQQRNRIADLEHQIEGLAGDAEQRAAEHAQELAAARVASAERCQDLAADLEQARADLDGLASDLVTARGARDDVQQQRDHLAQELESARQQLAEITADHGAQTGALVSERDRLASEREQIAAEREQIVAEREQLAAELQAQRETVKQLTAQLEQKRADHDALLSARQQVEAQLENAGHARGEAERLADERAAQLAAAQRDLAEVNERCERLRGQLAERGGEVGQLLEQLAQRQAELEAARQAIGQLQGQIDPLRASADRQQQQLGEAQ